MKKRLAKKLRKKQQKLQELQQETLQETEEKTAQTTQASAQGKAEEEEIDPNTTMIFYQFPNYQIERRHFFEKAIHQWEEQGHRAEEIQTLDVYFKTAEKREYYIINGEFKGFVNV